jgi:hypothetical protein
MKSLEELHSQFPAATVCSEEVSILAVHSDDEKIRGVLGAVVPEATILVSYPDGERGYVQESDLRNG